MNKLEAILEIVAQGYRDKHSKASIRRLNRALISLRLDPMERIKVLRSCECSDKMMRELTGDAEIVGSLDLPVNKEENP